ncbi:MAG: Unknown protein [uncultured Sulfurovum sp.]|uniref:AraC effector-binding domain-containing protein n=1 Tax=uncultured Sulfurovum sp. TaxID=269237 RepID=A0A6S6TXG2_9BACT|nr:MAG: Unknown protein [uncultured Sulfurovum sp.]
MPNIKKVQIESKEIKGLQVRTKNSDEMNQEKGKIAPLWEKFYKEIMPKLSNGAIVYGVYHNYESDVRGAFDVLVGVDKLELEEEIREVVLNEGQYLMFPVNGVLPQSIIETWEKVWAYFEDESIDERRAYETDFEKYISANEAQIYISVNYF